MSASRAVSGWISAHRSFVDKLLRDLSRSRGGILTWSDRRVVEKLLGVSLPAHAADVRYFKWQPSTDLAVYDAFIKFCALHEDCLDLVRRRGLTLFSDSGPTAHLPTAWKQSDEFERLSWWDPGSGGCPIHGT